MTILASAAPSQAPFKDSGSNQQVQPIPGTDAAGNPVHALVGNTTVTANLGTLNGAATDANLVAIKNAIQAQVDLATLFLTDNGNPPKFYVRRETINEGTGAVSVTVENIDGTVPSPAPTGLAPLTQSPVVTVESTFFDVAVAATGYAVGDVIARAIFTNTATGSVTSSWQNVTQGATLPSAPAPANIVEQTRNIAVTSTALAPGSATFAAQQSILTALGSPAQAGAAQGAGENHLGEVGGNTGIAVGTFTRPANTTAYASTQLVANSTTAGSVVPITLAIARKNAGTGRITKVRLTKSSNVLTNANFRVHLYKTLPTPSNGDGAAWLTDQAINYLGSFDITMDRSFTDGAKGSGVSQYGGYAEFDAPSGTTTLYALIEARAAYTPVSGEVFTLAIVADRD